MIYIFCRFDHDTLSGEGELYVPKMRVSFEYDASGTAFGPSPLTDSGYCKGEACEYFKSYAT